jgi:hypothetical protein
MATLTFNLPTESGAALRRMSLALEQLAQSLPDKQVTGATTVLTVDNAPSSGWATVQLTAGPITTAAVFV